MNIGIDEALARRRLRAARAAGTSLDVYVRQALEQAAAADPDWAVDAEIARAAAAEGDAIPWKAFEPQPRRFGKADRDL